MVFGGRFGRLILLAIIVALEASIFFSILYLLPSSSTDRATLTYVFDGTFFASVVVAWQSIRVLTSPARRMADQPDPRFIYSTVVNDTDTETYKRRLKMASDLYLQGTINTDEEFFWHVGEHTPREERVFRALKEARENFRKFAKN